LPAPPPKEPPPIQDWLVTEATSLLRPFVPPPLSESASEDFPHYRRYAAYTQAREWRHICDLNGVELDSFNTRKELNVLSKHLEPNEVVFALTSGVMSQTSTSNASDWGLNTWLVILTSERFLFLDHAMLTSSVDSQSIRHDRVQAVSASQGWVLGKVAVDIGSRTITIDNCPKATVTPMAQLANKWLAVLQKRKENQQAKPTAGASLSDELKKLAELHSQGLLSDSEFAAAKARLLG
jgi:hypothetical protein